MEQLIFTAVAYSQLLEDVRTIVRHETAARRSAAETPTIPPTDELLTVRQAAALLDVCPQTIHEWKRAGRLSFHKLARRTYLKRAEVLAALTAHTRTAKPGRTITAVRAASTTGKGGRSRG